jgi:hypothetical protein
MTDEVLDILVQTLQEHDHSPSQIAAIVCLEQFSMTGENKQRIMNHPQLMSIITGMAANNQVDNNSPNDDKMVSSRRRQTRFCAEWFLNRVLLFNSNNNNNSSSSSNDVCRTNNHLPTNNNDGISAVCCFFDAINSTSRLKISTDGLEVRNDSSSFESYRACRGVQTGVWYYEVTLLTDGIMQIGWANNICRFDPDEGSGVGDDIDSIAFDGNRGLLWKQSPGTHVLPCSLMLFKV